MAGRELEDLFRTWRSEPVPPSLPAGVDDRGGSAVVAAALRRVAERQQKQRQRRRWGVALAMAAAITGLGVGAWFELGTAPLLAQGGRGSSVLVSAPVGAVAVTDDVGRVLDAAVALTEGYGVRTADGSATLDFPSGAHAQVARESALKVTRAREKEALFLARGGVEVEVPKLDAEGGFSVETPDARVTVHGTHFSVFVEPAGTGSRTRVQVAHGIVSVQQDGREVFLTAGQSWPEAPPAQPTLVAPEPARAELDDAADAAEDDADPSLAPSSFDTQGPGVAGSRGKPRKFDSRELADQNQRFARAMNLKKAGDGAGALRELGVISRRYPGSPLTQELRVERLRLLRGLGRSELALREAKRYLREFPDGYAVSEAQAVVSRQP